MISTLRWEQRSKSRKNGIAVAYGNYGLPVVKTKSMAEEISTVSSQSSSPYNLSSTPASAPSSLAPSTTAEQPKTPRTSLPPSEDSNFTHICTAVNKENAIITDQPSCGLYLPQEYAQDYAEHVTPDLEENVEVLDPDSPR